MVDRSVVSVDWLRAHLGEPGLRVVDMRGSVVTRQLEPGVEEAEYRGARKEYLAGHIPGAVYIDWTRDIVDPDDPVPVQLARPEAFARVMGERGIGDETFVVAVDHHGGQFATRIWWALRHLGHDAVGVLDGGFGRWVDEGGEVESGEVVVEPCVFTVRPSLIGRVTAESLRDRLAEPGLQILDARDVGQFLGEKRRGPRGGRVPNALSLPRERFFRAEGGFLAPDAVRNLASEAGLEAGQPVIGYCNGGVAATVALFQLYRAGFTDLANYDGSWNEWGAREDLPVETGSSSR